jgi:hypothetical protein
MSAGATCILKVVRRTGYADRFRSYKIFVNGTQVGTIARDTVLDLEVPCGPVTVEARIDWCRSRPLMIEAAPNQKIELEVLNRWGALLSLGAITFGFRSYLIVRRPPS